MRRPIRGDFSVDRVRGLSVSFVTADVIDDR